jgi:hypothetical protein
VTAHQKVRRVTTMCRVLGVSLSGYYAWRKRPIAARTRADVELTGHLDAIHRASRGTYGAPRVHAELAALGTRGLDRIPLQGAARVRGHQPRSGGLGFRPRPASRGGAPHLPASGVDLTYTVTTTPSLTVSRPASTIQALSDPSNADGSSQTLFISGRRRESSHAGSSGTLRRN